MRMFLPFLLPVLGAASCACPSSYPYCKTNRWCYKSASSGSYTSSCARRCTTPCSCPSSYPYCSKSNKWCYKSSTSYSYSRTCAAKCSSSYSSSRGSCTCPSSYPYCYPKNKWCYKSSTSSSYTRTCGAKCTASGSSGGGSRRRAGGTKSASGLGTFIANWVKTKLGQRVRSKLQGTTQCWDLAMRAIEEARAKGWRIPFSNSGYVWSNKKVPYYKAMPGDIAQFSSWYEKHGYSWTMTGYRHTAVVVEPYNKAKGAVITYDQNPHPVKKSEYHPKYRTRGSMIIYRLPGTARTRLYTEEESVEASDTRQSWWVMVSAVALVGLGVSGVVLRRRKRSTDDSMPKTPQEVNPDDQEILLAGSE